MKSRHMTHGDLKPENILVDINKEGLVVKLCDFGTCQSTTPGTLLSSVYVGTAGFHSPEVWLTPELYWYPPPPSATHLTHLALLSPYASDVFSLGCIALEIILREVDFLRIWMPCYEIRDDHFAFQHRLSEIIPSVQHLIQVTSPPSPFPHHGDL
jgi:serine/threonine protein kinase